MSTETNPITDAELIRYLDGELDAGTRSALDRRLARAPEAAARLEMLRKRSRAMSQLMRTANPSGPSTRASADAIRPLLTQRVPMQWAPYLRIAAVIAVLLVGFVPPVRAWLVSHLLSATRLISGDRPAAAPTAPAVPSTTAPSVFPDVVYNFMVSSDTFDLEVTRDQGTLVVKPSADGNASAQALGAGTSFLVLPHGLRIDGPHLPTAQYTIALPARVRVLRVHRPGGVSLHALNDGVLVLKLGRR